MKNSKTGKRSWMHIWHIYLTSLPATRGMLTGFTIPSFLGKPLLSENMECMLIGQALTLKFCMELFQLGRETFVTTVRIISMQPLHAHSHFQLIIDLPRFPTQFHLPVLVHHIIVLINRKIVPTIRENKSVITLTFVHVSIKRTVNFCISVGAVRKMITL